MILKFDKDLVIAIGDIHGEFNNIVFKINSQYEITDSICIACGDIGMGFYKFNYYKDLFSKLNSKLKKANNHLLLIRGNHDNPIYFNETCELNKFTHIKLLDDYSIVETPTRCILNVGGAYSIDRSARMKSGTLDYCYWKDEPFIYDESKLNNIESLFGRQITHVCTHSAPKECEPRTKEGLIYWLEKDLQLKNDIEKERNDHSMLMKYLLDNKQPIRQWCYGHYHYTKTEFLNGIKFCLLDICQIIELS